MWIGLYGVAKLLVDTVSSSTLGNTVVTYNNQSLFYLLISAQTELSYVCSCLKLALSYIQLLLIFHYLVIELVQS